MLQCFRVLCCNMSLIQEDDEFFSTIDQPLSKVDVPLGRPSPLGTKVSVTASAPTGFASESHGGIPYGRNGTVSYDVHICASPNQLKQAFKSAAVIPVSLENGFISNFQVIAGDKTMATDPNIPKIPTALKIDQVTIDGINKPLLLECVSYSALEGEKFKGTHSGSLVPLAANPPHGSLTLSIRDNSISNRADTLPMAVLGYAQEHGAPTGMRGTYAQSQSNPADAHIDVTTIPPYIGDYNNHADVLSGHLDPITNADIQYARAKNNGLISRKGAFQIIDTLAANAESTVKTYVPFALQPDLSAAEFRVVIGAVSQFDSNLGKMVLKTLTFDTLHLGLREGTTFKKEDIEKGNDKIMTIGLRITADYLAFPRSE